MMKAPIRHDRFPHPSPLPEGEGDQGCCDFHAKREICLHVLAGRSHSEIAREMAIKPSTVIYFTRQLYLKLGITRQAELLPALLSEMPSPTG
jgi:hypothetical protein